MKTPEISVYLPTRNRAYLLRESVQSVLRQSFSDLELIVVDDASEDDTPAVMREITASDSRVRSIRLQTRSGACVARNTAINAAQGIWCTGIDDDDLMLPTRVASLHLSATKGDQFSLFCSGFFLERRGRRLRRYCKEAIITLDDLLHRNVIGNQALFRRSHALAVGGFDVDLPASQDYDFWTRLVERFGPALRTEEPTYVFRESEQSLVRITTSEASLHGALRYTEKHRNLMSAAHLKSQRLLHHYVAGKPLTLGLAVSCADRKTIEFILRYAAQRFPVLSRLRDTLHRGS